MPANLVNLCRVVGLHPLVGFGMIAVDLMLFGGEAATMMTLAVISAVVGILLTIPCALIQRFCYLDPWGAAIGKALLVGLLTAIPTPLPAAVTLMGAVAGILGVLLAPPAPPPAAPAEHHPDPR